MTTAKEALSRSELEAYWLPFTPNRHFKSQPRLLERASGMYYWTADGRQILDGVAGLWCVNAGHGRREITDAVAAQLETLDYAPPFQMAHTGAFRLANELTRIAPAGLDHVFFTNSGSESVDTALKIALAYHRVRGEGTRTRLIGRERAYHGVGFGGISVGGIAPNRKMWSARCCRASITCRTRTTWRVTPSRAASRRTARSSPMSSSGWWRCTMPPTSPR